MAEDERDGSGTRALESPALCAAQIEALTQSLLVLQAERERLRAAAGEEEALAENGLAIVERQWRLSEALLAQARLSR